MRMRNLQAPSKNGTQAVGGALEPPFPQVTAKGNKSPVKHNAVSALETGYLTHLTRRVSLKWSCLMSCVRFMRWYARQDSAWPPLARSNWNESYCHSSTPRSAAASWEDARRQVFGRWVMATKARHASVNNAEPSLGFHLGASIFAPSHTLSPQAPALQPVLAGSPHQLAQTTPSFWYHGAQSALRQPLHSHWTPAPA